jgi:hypothetical protein
METINRDPQLWRLAKQRAKFKSHLVVFLLVNSLLWLIWAVTSRNVGYAGLPWPLWSTLFWGLGLGIQGFATYGRINPSSWSEREYARLQRQREEGRL